MTTTTTVKEFSGLGKITGKTKWRTRIIGSGPGSSGFYSREVLERDIPTALPPGTKMNLDHQSETSEWDQPAGTLATLVGATISEPQWRDLPEPGMYADIEVSEQYAGFIEQYHEIIGVSIRALAMVSETDFDEASGKPLVSAILPSPLNTVDFVTVPGANGRLIEALENYRCGTMTNESLNETETQEETSMDIEDVRTVVAEEIAKAVEALAPQNDEAKEGAAVSDVFSKVKNSGLTDLNQAAIIKAFEADNTVDVDSLIADRQELENAIRSEVETKAQESYRVDYLDEEDDFETVAQRIKAGK